MWTVNNHKLEALSKLEGWNTGMLDKWVLASGSESLRLGEDSAILGKRSTESGATKLRWR
jgi:hypothetical protein